MNRDHWAECETCDGSGQVITHEPTDWNPYGTAETCPACNGRRGKWVSVPWDYELISDKAPPVQNWLFLLGAGAAFLMLGILGGHALTAVFLTLLLEIF